MKDFGYLKKSVLTISCLILFSSAASATLLGDYVWHDMDRDGIQDADETGLAGVFLQLYDCDGNLLKESPTATDETGYYKFSVPDYGSYYVMFLPPEGYIFSPRYQGGDVELDSNADSNGMTECTTLTPDFPIDFTLDAGLYIPDTPPPSDGAGCTPGFWRNHLDEWTPTGYAPGDDFDATFSVDYFSPDINLEQAVNMGGGGVNKLARHGTAALLSAAHPDVGYPYTVAEVIAFVQAGNVDPLEDANELGCSIN